jgi:hypothetical protein
MHQASKRKQKKARRGRSEIGIKVNSQLAKDHMNSYIDEIFSRFSLPNPVRPSTVGLPFSVCPATARLAQSDHRR